MSGATAENLVYLTFDEMVDDMVRENETLDDNDRKRLQHLYWHGKLIVLHSTYGMNIRNHYSLWHTEHPINKKWNEEGCLPDSEHHPDQVSMKAIEKMCERMFGSKEQTK